MAEVLSPGTNSIYWSYIDRIADAHIYPKGLNVVPFFNNTSQLLFVDFLPTVFDPTQDTFVRIFLNNTELTTSSGVKIRDASGFVSVFFSIPSTGVFTITVKSLDLSQTYQVHSFNAKDMYVLTESYGVEMGNLRIEDDAIRRDILWNQTRDSRLSDWGTQLNVDQPVVFSINEYRTMLLGTRIEPGMRRAYLRSGSIRGVKDAVRSVTGQDPIITYDRDLSTFVTFDYYNDFALTNQIVFQDTFVRTNGPLLYPWFDGRGQFAISSNELVVSSMAPIYDGAWTLVDTGVADGTYQVTLSNIANAAGIIFRGIDIENFLYFWIVEISPFPFFNLGWFVNGSQVGSFAGGVLPSASNGDIVKIVTDGPLISVYYGQPTPVLLMTVSNPLYQDGTMQGVQAMFSSSTAAWNNFSVTFNQPNDPTALPRFFSYDSPSSPDYNPAYVPVTYDGQFLDFSLNLLSTNSLRTVTQEPVFRTPAALSMTDQLANRHILTHPPSTFSSVATGVTGIGLFESVFFINASTGWAVTGDGFLAHTTNGGATWTSVNIGHPLALYSVFFISEYIGWIVGAQGHIWKTINGGSSWSTQISGTTNDLRSVFFTDANNGWAVGASGTVLHTANGGSTWTPQTSGVSVIIYSVAFENTNQGYAVGQNGTFLTTANGGAIWTSQSSGTGNHLFSVCVDVAGDQTPIAHACGGQGEVWVTYDSGNNWIPQNSGNTDFFYNISFATPSLGWMAGSNAILYTTDCGNTWTQIYTAPDMGFGLAAAPDTGGTIVYFGGNVGDIYSNNVQQGEQVCITQLPPYVVSPVSYIEGVDFSVDRTNGLVTWMGNTPADKTIYYVDYKFYMEDIIVPLVERVKPAVSKINYEFS